MNCDRAENIWLENELSDKQRADLEEHIKNCHVCSKEYESKKTFNDIVDDFIDRTKQVDLDHLVATKPKIKNRRTKFIPLVAALLVVLLMSSIAYSKGGVEYFKEFTTKNFGWSYGVIQDGQSFAEDNLVVNISPIAVSKSNIVFAVSIENLKDDNLVYRAEDIWIESNGNMCRPNGFVGADFEKGMGYGELSFDLNDELSENILIKIENFDIYKIKKNEMVKTNKSVEGVFEYPIAIEKEIIAKANNNAVVYPLEKTVEVSDLRVEFDALEVEGTRAVIRYNIEKDSFVEFGDVKILDANGGVISERHYEKGILKFTDDSGSTSVAMVDQDENEVVLLPFASSQPATIEIASFVAKQDYGLIALSDHIAKWALDSEAEMQKKVGQITYKDIILNVSMDSNLNEIEITCSSPKLLELVLYSSNKALEPIESKATVGLDEDELPGSTEYYSKYMVNADDDLRLELVEVKEFPTDIQIQLTK